ncbi:MAG: hypothetical protein U9P42_06695 [Candidatus Fermentibacteria bacterium]|nr:hypothetical protein [Candidatus Fermentibacteria bacterium]
MRTICKTSILPVAMFLFLSGCKPSVDANTWVLATGNDTVYVGDLGEAWIQLDSTKKALFQSMENTAEEYVITYGRKLVIEKELQAEGLLDDSINVYARESWFLYRNAAFVKQMLISREADAVSEDDISYYRLFLGKNVGFTVNPGSDRLSESIYAHLPDLPPHLGMHLDTLETGQTAPDATGLEVRLDYVTVTDSTLIKHALEDSSIVAEMAIEGLSEARYARRTEIKLAEIFHDYSVSVDSSAVDTLSLFLLGAMDLPGDRIIVHSNFRDWTVDDLGNQLYFLNTKINIQPDSPKWLLEMINTLILQCYYLELMESESQATLDSLSEEADGFLLEIASNQYYENVIRSNLTITDDNIAYEYEHLQEPFMIQEKRRLQLARIPFERIDEYERAASEGQLDEFTSELEGIQYLTADPSEPQITYPIGYTLVPGGHGEEIFQLASSDTVEWQGPFNILADDDMVLIKLIDIFPERVATIDESIEELKTLALQRLEEEAILSLILQLEEKYELEINVESLDLLPDDPALWTQL